MRKPQDLPAGDHQMVIAVVLNFVTYFIALISLYGIGTAALHAVLDIACTGLFLYVALALTGKLLRFPQSFGAICGAGAILNIAAIPMLRLEPDRSAEAAMGLAELAQFVLLVWSLSLVAHVLRHTFNIRMFTSIGVAVLYYLFIVTLLSQIFPSAVGMDDQLSENQAVVSFLLHSA